MKRYFRHKERFSDGSAYIIEDYRGITIVDYDGTLTKSSYLDHDTIMKYVNFGDWVEITESEAKKLSRPVKMGGFRINWISVDDRKPEPFTEVLVWIDGHRGPAWKNNHAIVAYMDSYGDWHEERHPSVSPLIGVLCWAIIEEPVWSEVY